MTSFPSLNMSTAAPSNFASSEYDSSNSTEISPAGSSHDVSMAGQSDAASVISTFSMEPSSPMDCEPSSPPKISDQARLLQPPNPRKQEAKIAKFGNAKSAQASASSSTSSAQAGASLSPQRPQIMQTISTLVKAKAHPLRDSYPSNLDDLIEKENPFPNQLPAVEKASVEIAKREGINKDALDPKFEGHQLSGQVPIAAHLKGTLVPETADYRERRPDQLLSQMSSVMKWKMGQISKQDLQKLKDRGLSAKPGTTKRTDPKQKKDQVKADNQARKKNMERAGLKEPLADPVEVQFGYLEGTDANRNKTTKLYSSTNNKETQAQLAELLQDPMKHVKEAAKQNEDPDVKRKANKLLFFHENQKARRADAETMKNDAEKTIKDPEKMKDPEAKAEAEANAAKAEKHIQSLDDAASIYKHMFTGTHTVVESGQTVADGAERHAEQNIAEAAHKNGFSGMLNIQGTKVRCFSCTASLGANLKDENEAFTIAGKAWHSQSSKDAAEEQLKGVKDSQTGEYVPQPDGRGRTLVNDGPGSDIPRSPSPVNFPEDDSSNSNAGSSGLKRAMADPPTASSANKRRRGIYP